MNDFLDDILARIADEAQRMRIRSRLHTCNASDIEAAVKLLLPRRLQENAIHEATKSIFFGGLEHVYTKPIWTRMDGGEPSEAEKWNKTHVHFLTSVLEILAIKYEI